jgi:hypothetical protein
MGEEEARFGEEVAEEEEEGELKKKEEASRRSALSKHAIKTRMELRSAEKAARPAGSITRFATHNAARGRRACVSICTRLLSKAK